jgi:hypothetical protein
MNPIALEKLPMSIELRISLSPFIKCTRLLRPCHVNLGVFTRTPFSLYPVWRNLTLQRMDGATVDAWLYFPGIKVGQNDLYSSFWTFMGHVHVDYKSLRSRNICLFLS